MKPSDFDYPLPEGQIALHPASPRDAARLLVVERAAGRRTDARVRDLPRFLEPGDLIVVNDTKVLHARLFGRRASGGRIELLLLRRDEGGDHETLVRAHGSLRPGETLAMDGGICATLLERPGGGALWRARLVADGDLDTVLERAGHVPLPPYIKRPDDALDRERYQTIFAAHPGSAAAPTAGLHFTPALLDALAARGIGVAKVTLHVGYGTFQPVEAERIEEHRMHAEEFEVSEQAARAIRERRGRLMAVGTTTTRLLETLAATGGVRAARGRTDLFLHPGHVFRAVDLLFTNFHLPRSSLLMLACAFAGRERVLDAYAHALAAGYRFTSYGDATLFV
ncbi:MAG: tRNA preQ1(34) S-adenosylmethionine ribosyltransferase-isomerase QueA [Planctomycetaceae bacterium]